MPEGTPLTLEFGPDLTIEAEARWSDANRVGVRFAEAVETARLIGQPRPASDGSGRIERAA